MAKKFELHERETNEVIYPVTLAECVLNDNGKSIKDNLIPEGGEDGQTLVKTEDGVKWTSVSFGDSGLSKEEADKLYQPIGTYATEQWVENKNYLTEHQSLDNYYTKEEIDSKKGCNRISDLSKVPVTKKLCSAYIASSQSLELEGTLESGQELHIIIINTGTDTITIAIPDTFKSIIDTLEIEEGSFGEINIISDGTNLFVRAL